MDTLCFGILELGHILLKISSPARDITLISENLDSICFGILELTEHHLNADQQEGVLGEKVVAVKRTAYCQG